MNDATLQYFRSLADTMYGPEPRDWEWLGPSQRMFGLTKQQALEYVARYGGEARQMES